MSGYVFRCPHCGSHELLYINVNCMVKLEQDTKGKVATTPIDDNFAWTDNSDMSCGRCGKIGRAVEFWVGTAEQKRVLT